MSKLELKIKWALFLDDERNLTDVIDEPRLSRWNWIVCRSTDEAKRAVQEHGLPSYMSLDHDLGGLDTARSFITWLCDHNYAQGPGEWQIHSQNPVGKEYLESFLKSWKKSLRWDEINHEDD